jgi:hypothetical protein
VLLVQRLAFSVALVRNLFCNGMYVLRQRCRTQICVKLGESGLTNTDTKWWMMDDDTQNGRPGTVTDVNTD